jgi:oligopeptide transport system permease protein
MSICFILIKLLPLPNIGGIGQDTKIIEIRRELMGYNHPLPVQYLYFWRNVLKGDWGLGEQMYYAQEVSKVLLDKMPATITVNLYSTIISVPLGILLGIFSALKKNKWQDQVISVMVMLFISVPSFVYAFLVQYIFCHILGWFPYVVLSLDKAGGYFTWKMFDSMVPAIMALGFGSVASLARFTRAELTETLTSDYMLLARTKGLTRAQATIRHALKNAMVPIVPMIIGEFIGILGGSLIIEGIFSIPGIGKLYLQSISARDYNFFMALSAFYTLIGLVAGIVVDLSYGFIDPRIRMGSVK